MGTTLIGILAAIAGIAAFGPQAWKIIITRKTTDLSAPMWVLQTCAFALWIAYGIGLQQWPIIVPNAINLALAAFILTMKLLPRRHREKVCDAVTSAVDS